MTSLRAALCSALTFTALVFPTHGFADPLTLKQAVQLALTHSTTAVTATADEQKALASYQEVRNAYIPSLAVGAGLGASWGFPLSLAGSAPSLFNVNAQSVLYNPAHRQFLNAARTDYEASKVQTKDQREQVMQDTVTTYLEIVNWERRLQQVREESDAAVRMEQAVSERLKEGVDSELDMYKAKLATARVRLRLAQARGSSEVLREHLAKLTGLPTQSLEVVTSSVPQMPDVPQGEALPDKAEAISPAIQLADQRSMAARFRALGEHRALLPSFDFAAQYALLSKFNNYDVYYNAFQRNNATVGVSIVFPFLNSSQRARARAADAEALKAQKQAESTRNQVSEETLRLQRSVEQLSAARDVAELEYQVARSGLDAAQGRSDLGSGTLHEVADARAQASEQYVAAQDAAIELDKARISLMRLTGELEKWVQNAPN